MTDNAIIIRLKNPEDTLRPETLGIGDLYKVAKLIEDAILAAAASRGLQVDSDSDGPDAPLVSLTEIMEGTARLRLTLAATILAAATEMKAALYSGNFDHVPQRCQERLAELSRFLVGKQWAAEVAGITPGRAVISDVHPVPAPKRRTIQEHTTVYGKCVRVGGDTPRVSLRLTATGHLLYVDVSAGLAEALGKRLYDDVGLTGVVTRDAATLDILSFRAKSVTVYRGKAADPMGALDRLTEMARQAKAAGTWQDADDADDGDDE